MKKLKVNTFITIDDETIKLCEQFVDKVHGTVEEMWEKRQEGGGDPAKRKSDHLMGKKAEFALYKYLLENGYNVSPPDIKIYEAKEKNFSKDLKIISPITDKVYLFHVKCMRLEDIKKYNQPSYLMTKKDDLIRFPNFNDYLGLMVENNRNTYRFVNNLPAVDVFPDYVELPKNIQQRKFKIAIYYENIRKGLIAKYNTIAV